MEVEYADISDHNFLSPGYIWRNIVAVLQKPEVDTINKGVRTIMFGNIRHKLEDHVEETMIDQLANTGECVIPNVGKIVYDADKKTIELKYTAEFQSRIEARERRAKKH